MSKNTTKREWKNDMKRMLEHVANHIIQQISTREVRLMISSNLTGTTVGSFEVETYKKKQNYKFSMEKNSRNMTEIFVYQEDMRVNENKYIILSENIPFNQLEYETQCLYRDMMINFLMGNIVWK